MDLAKLLNGGRPKGPLKRPCAAPAKLVSKQRRCASRVRHPAALRDPKVLLLACSWLEQSHIMSHLPYTFNSQGHRTQCPGQQRSLRSDAAFTADLISDYLHPNIFYVCISMSVLSPRLWPIILLQRAAAVFGREFLVERLSFLASILQSYVSRFVVGLSCNFLIF